MTASFTAPGTPCDDIDIMIGDNDGYGFGASVVPDGHDIPSEDSYIFDNRDSSEVSATDGSQYTDIEDSWGEGFTFTITFPIVEDPDYYDSATFTLDVTGIQTNYYGASSLYLDDWDYSQYLPQEQNIYGSQIAIIGIDVSRLLNGSLTVNFRGGTGGIISTNHDAIGFDYFRLQVQCADRLEGPPTPPVDLRYLPTP